MAPALTVKPDVPPSPKAIDMSKYELPLVKRAPTITKFNGRRFRIATNGYMFMPQFRANWLIPIWSNIGMVQDGYANRAQAQAVIDARIEYLKTQGPWRAA